MASKKPEPRTPQLELAGALCVAFVNTAGARDKNSQQGVKSYGELVTWGQQAGLLSTNEAERLRRLASERPDDASAVYASAYELRGSLARIFHTTSRDKDFSDDDLAVVNAATVRTLPVLRLVRQEGGVTVGWSGDDDALDRMLWPVVHSAVEILVEIAGDSRVRQCGAKGCYLYFLVRGGRKRRWCTPACGNRARSLAYYYRYGRDDRDRLMRQTGQWRRRRPRKSKA